MNQVAVIRSLLASSQEAERQLLIEVGRQRKTTSDLRFLLSSALDAADEDIVIAVEEDIEDVPQLKPAKLSIQDTSFNDDILKAIEKALHE